MHDGPRHGRPLLLSAGHFVGKAANDFGGPEIAHHLVHAIVQLFAPLAVKREGQVDIFQ